MAKDARGQVPRALSLLTLTLSRPTNRRDSEAAFLPICARGFFIYTVGKSSRVWKAVDLIKGL